MKSQRASNEVEGHAVKWSDDSFKQAVTEVEIALQSLRELESGGDAEVEGHVVKWSDEDLKQAITKLDDALQSLRELGRDVDA